MPSYHEIEALAHRAIELSEYIASEEGSKTSLVLPMLGALGYDIFNPKQVAAELTADVGIKRGEKVDYALMAAGKPKLIIECKKIGDPLGKAAISQLFRYYTALRVRFGVLTDGITYQFFTDIDTPNIMDSTPFFEFNLLAYTQADLEFLFRFRKGCLTGQMKALVRECKKRKLTAIVRDAMRYSLGVTELFVLDTKDSLSSTSLASITKKELTRVASRVALEEALRVVEENLRVDRLLEQLKPIIASEIGRDLADLVTYRLTANSVYLESATGKQLLRVFSSGLDLKVHFSNSTGTRSIRVVDDIRRYSDDIIDCLSAANIRS